MKCFFYLVYFTKIFFVCFFSLVVQLSQWNIIQYVSLIISVPVLVVLLQPSKFFDLLMKFSNDSNCPFDYERYFFDTNQYAIIFLYRHKSLEPFARHFDGLFSNLKYDTNNDRIEGLNQCFGFFYSKKELIDYYYLYIDKIFQYPKRLDQN